MSKVIVVKELSLVLDVMSIERTGFEIISVLHIKKSLWEVNVKAYKKEGDFSHEDKVSLATILDRLSKSYVSDFQCEVTYAKKRTEDIFMFMAKVEGEENETEDDSSVEEQVEA